MNQLKPQVDFSWAERNISEEHHLIAMRGGESGRSVWFHQNGRCNGRLPVRLHHHGGGSGGPPVWPCMRGGSEGRLVGLAVAGDGRVSVWLHCDVCLREAFLF